MNDQPPDDYADVLEQLRAPVTLDPQLRDRQIATALAAATVPVGGQSADVSDLGARRRRGNQRLVRVLAAAATVLVVGGVSLLTIDQLGRTSDDTVAEKSALADSGNREAPATTETALGGRADRSAGSPPGVDTSEAAAAVDGSGSSGDLGSFGTLEELRSTALARKGRVEPSAAPSGSSGPYPDDSDARQSPSVGSSTTAGPCDGQLGRYVDRAADRWTATVNGVAVLVTVDAGGRVLVMDAASCTEIASTPTG